MSNMEEDTDEEDEDGDLKLDEQTENSLKGAEVVTVGEGDEQQYVVLEVIQLEDGTEQQITVVAPEYPAEEEEVVEEAEDEQVEEEVEVEMEEEEFEEENEADDGNDDDGDEERFEIYNKAPLVLNKQFVRRNRAGMCIKPEKDVDTCFGFDEEDEPEEEEEVTYNEKMDIEGGYIDELGTQARANIEVPITYENKNNDQRVSVRYDKNQGIIDTLPITYDNQIPENELSANKLFEPSIAEALADLPSDSLLTLVTIIADEEAVTLPITYSQEDSDMPEIPEEGENITYIEQNPDGSVDEEDVYGDNIVLQLV